MKNEHTNGLQFWPRQPVKVRHGRLWPAVAICAGMTFAAGNVVAQLAPNQTNGFGNHGLVTFTYLQNFDCLDEPTMDLDFNAIRAQSDPNEMQTPICQVVTEPSQDPTGRSLEHTGVVPDEALLPTAQDLAAGRDPVLSRAISLCGAETTPETAGGYFPFIWKR